MVIKKLKKAKRKVKKKREKAEKKADLERRVRKQKELDRERRIKRSDPKGIVETAKVARNEAAEVGREIKRLKTAKSPTASDRQKRAADVARTVGSKFSTNDSDSSLFNSDGGGESDLYDTSGGMDITGGGGGGASGDIDVGDFGGGGDLGEFDLGDDDDDLFG
jgi:hypothetical protein